MQSPGKFHRYYFPIFAQHKSCSFYCIVLLTALFVSSCYWQPLSLDTPLAVPWSENITTFSEALNATISSSYTKPLPSTLRAVDRCWCDLQGGLFEPFNVTRWEHASVKRLKDDLEKKQRAEEAAITQEVQELRKKEKEMLKRDPADSTIRYTKDYGTRLLWNMLTPLRSKSANSSSTNITDPVVVEVANDSTDSMASTAPDMHGRVDSKAVLDYPLIRPEYDLRPFGLDMLIDFRWSRGDPSS